MLVLLFVLPAVLLAPSTAPAAPPGSWLPAASAPSAGLRTTATSLNDGRVLALQLVDFYGNSAAGIYDPRSDTWVSMGTIATGWFGSTATLLLNGKVLIVGLRGAMLYDADTNRWSSAGEMTTPRSEHTATLLADGEVLVTGGQASSASFLASSELYDPDSNTWHAAASLPMNLAHHTATRLANGRVLVAGGVTLVTPYLPLTVTTAELYDPASDSWLATGSATRPRHDHRAVLLRSGQVLVLGGCLPPDIPFCESAPEIYDPASETWRVTGAPVQPRRFFPTATVLADGDVLVAGGFLQASCPESTASAEVYDPISDSWRETDSLATARGDHAAVRLGRGGVIAIGGRNVTATPLGAGCSSTRTSLASAEIYRIGNHK